MSEVLRKCLVAQQKDNIAHTVVSQPHEVEGMKLPVKVIHWQKKKDLLEPKPSSIRLTTKKINYTNQLHFQISVVIITLNDHTERTNTAETQ